MSDDRASLFSFLPWLDLYPLWVKLYLVVVALLGAWVLWRIFGPRGSAW